MISRNELLALPYKIPVNLCIVAVKVKSILAILKNIIENLLDTIIFTNPLRIPGALGDFPI